MTVLEHTWAFGKHVAQPGLTQEKGGKMILPS